MGRTASEALGTAAFVQDCEDEDVFIAGKVKHNVGEAPETHAASAAMSNPLTQRVLCDPGECAIGLLDQLKSETCPARLVPSICLFGFGLWLNDDRCDHGLLVNR